MYAFKRTPVRRYNDVRQRGKASTIKRGIPGYIHSTRPRRGGQLGRRRGWRTNERGHLPGWTRVVPDSTLRRNGGDLHTSDEAGVGRKPVDHHGGRVGAHKQVVVQRPTGDEDRWPRRLDETRSHHIWLPCSIMLRTWGTVVRHVAQCMWVWVCASHIPQSMPPT